MNYPNPCDSCEKSAQCLQGHGCQTWRIRYLTIQKQINAYPRRQYKKQIRKNNVFAYEHPDIMRQYLAHGPCSQCEREEMCDAPCTAYYHWWDARMAWIKGRLGL